MSQDPKALIQQCLGRPENKECADCKKPNPNWASANLGIFLCIECSGIHRSLGTHVSFIRSCTMDTWTLENAAKMSQIGNQISNDYYEATLPSNFVRPGNSNRYQMTKFINSKYVSKEWILDPNVPPPNEQTVVKLPTVSLQPESRHDHHKKPAAQKRIITRAQSEQCSLKTDDDEFDLFGEPANQRQRPSQQQQQQPQPSASNGDPTRKPGNRVPARLMKKLKAKEPSTRRSEPNLRRLSEEDPWA